MRLVPSQPTSRAVEEPSGTMKKSAKSRACMGPVVSPAAQNTTNPSNTASVTIQNQILLTVGAAGAGR